MRYSRGPDHDKHLRFWVLGQRTQDGKFEKLSVFSMMDENERMRICDLEFAEWSETVLC